MADQLKVKIESLEEVNEALHSFYKKTPDGYVLQHDGDSEMKGRLKSSQENNNSLKKELEEAQKSLAAFENVDPQKYAQMEKEITELKESKTEASPQASQADVEAEVKKRLAKMEEEKDGQIAELKKRADEAETLAASLKGRLDTNFIEGEIVKAANASGNVVPGGMVDILNRGKGVWHVNEDGNMYAKNEDGNIKYAKDATTPLTMEEWMEDTKKANPHLFKESTGGDAPGSNRSTAPVLSGGKRYVQADDIATLGKKHIQEGILSGEVEVVSGPAPA